jgi:hypothetical protein
VQPGTLLLGRELDVRTRPLPWPVVLVPVERGERLPVVPRQLERVPYPQPALLRAVDEEQTAERPERLAADARRRLLFDDDDPLARVGQLTGRHQAGQAPADHDHVRVQPCSPIRFHQHVR